MVACLLPVSRDLPLVAAFELALPDRICGVWLAGHAGPAPLSVRLAGPDGWRTLLLGPDLGQLLTLVDAALVDAGQGPVRLSGAELRAARTLEIGTGRGSRLVRLADQSPESILSAQPSRSQSRIRYLG